MKDENCSFLRHLSHFDERRTIMETKKQPQAKNEWKTPGLTILVRSKPDEAVLSACKGGGMANTAPAQNWTGCQTSTPCTACDVFAAS